MEQPTSLDGGGPGGVALRPLERIRAAGAAAWALVGLALVAAGVVWALDALSFLFPPVFLAAVIIYVVEPPVRWLQVRGVPRGLAVAGAYVAVLSLAAGALLVLIPVIAGQVAGFAERWPEYRVHTVRTLEDIADAARETLGIRLNTSDVACLLGGAEAPVPEAPTDAECHAAAARARAWLSAESERLTDLGYSVLTVIAYLVIAPFLALYLLVDLPRVGANVRRLLPESHRREVVALAGDAARTVGGFLRGQLLVSLAVGTLSALGFWIIGLPFWLLIGVLAGMFNLIPFLGPFIGGGIGFAVGVLSDGLGLGVQAAAVELVVQQIDNHLVSPVVMRRTVALHPALVIVAILTGGGIGGLWGALLAIPMVSATKLVAGHLWATRVLGLPSPRGIPVGPAPPDDG